MKVLQKLGKNKIIDGLSLTCFSTSTEAVYLLSLYILYSKVNYRGIRFCNHWHDLLYIFIYNIWISYLLMAKIC